MLFELGKTGLLLAVGGHYRADVHFGTGSGSIVRGRGLVEFVVFRLLLIVVRS